MTENAPTPTVQDTARNALRELSERAASRTEGLPDAEIAEYLAHLYDVLRTLAAEQPMLEAVGAAFHRRNEAAALHAGAVALTQARLHAAAVPLLGTALALGSRDPETVNALALCRAMVASDADGLAILHRHGWCLEYRSSREWCAEFAAMCGDLDQTRAMLPQLPDGESTELETRAAGRLKRAEALGRPPQDLRDWIWVLHGSVLLHSSPEGTDVMNGRYAAVWDNRQRLAEVLTLLEWVLLRTGRSPDRVVSFPDRDSIILGHLIRHRLGVGEDVATGTTLLVQYVWSGGDRTTVQPYLNQESVVFFGYGVTWTMSHPVAPDITGLEAQLLRPPWEGALRLTTDADGNQQVETTPPDDRDPAIIGAEMAQELAALPAYVQDDVGGVRDVVAALQRAQVRPALLGGPRHPYYSGGPVHSNQFG